MKERTLNTVVGITTVAGILGLALLLTRVGGLSKLFESGYRVTIELPTAAGLHKDGRIYYNGIDIGRIESVQFQSPPKTGVTAVALVTEDVVELPDDVTVMVTSPILGGSASAQFIRDDVPAEGYLPTDGSAVVQGGPAVDFSQVAQELREALGGPMDELSRISDNFEALSREWTLVGENVNQLVEQRNVDAVDDGDAVGNMATVLARADARLAELREAIDGLNKYVNDAQLHDDVRTTAANARQLSQRFNDSIEALRARYIAVADDLSAAVQSMQKLTEQARAGGGSFSKMISDPELYENLNDASERLKTAIDEARLLVEKWKAEGLPVQF